jgi:sodium/potassium-transporting ATPase subunit alpha
MDDDKKVDITEHLKTPEELSQLYSVAIDLTKPAASGGLNKQQVAERLEKYGLNRLTPPTKRHPLLVYIGYVLGLFNLMLVVAGIASLIIYGINPGENGSLVYIGSILVFVAFVNAFIEFYQVQKSQAILESFLVFFVINYRILSPRNVML